MKSFFLFLFFTFSISTLFSLENKFSDSIIEKVGRQKDVQSAIKIYVNAISDSWRTGKFNDGIYLGEKALKLSKKCKCLQLTSKIFLNIGINYELKAEYADALHNYMQAVRIQKKTKDKLGLANTYNNIGLLYYNQKDFQKANKYLSMFLSLGVKLKKEEIIKMAKANLALVYLNENEYEKALKYLFSALEYDMQKKDNYAIADSYNNIGFAYSEMKKFNESLNYYLKALEYRKKVNDDNGMGFCYNNIASVYSNLGENNKAIYFFKKAILIGKKIQSNFILEYAYDELSNIYERSKDAENAYFTYKDYVKIKDKIRNLEQHQKQTRVELEYIFDLKAEKEMHKNQAIQMKIENKVQKQRFIILITITFLFLIALFALFFVRKWKYEKKQNLIIEEQKKIVDNKNREVLDSITYAKRIQTAILPSNKLLNEVFQDFFIFYKPKDIVAGDFYWVVKKNNLLFFAVADCTGHGVPGAMISVVCHNALNRSVNEFSLIQPNLILEKSREIIIEEFSKNEEEVSDGMDISLCCLDTETNILSWSGANNPLWLMKRSSDDIEDVKPTKQPVGIYSRYEKFIEHSFQLQKGDTIYLMTDGFSDQFGGYGNKKFKTKRLKELIIKNNDSSTENIKLALIDSFESWKKDTFQVDDVCVMGVRI